MTLARKSLVVLWLILGPVEGPESAGGVVVATSSIPMTTASKVSDWERCCAMATGICQVDLSTQAKLR